VERRAARALPDRTTMAIFMAMRTTPRFSVADARNQLAALVHGVERGHPVEITRRGEPVAVLLSIVDYRRLASPSPDLLGALQRFRNGADLDALRADEVFAVERDRSPGRSVSW
jgi:prevent-host-death family protein